MSGQLALLCPTARPPPDPSRTRGRESHAIDGRATSSSARCKVIRRRDGPLPAFFRPSRGGRLEVLEFPCFFRGISFCQNAGGAGRKPFRPGVKRPMYPHRGTPFTVNASVGKNGHTCESACPM